MTRLWAKIYPGISARVTTPFLLVILVVAAIGALIISRLVAGNLEERLANQLADSAQAAVNTVTDIERQQLSILRAMAFTTGVDAAIAENRPADLEALLLPIAANNRVDDLIVFDATGRMLYRLTPVDGQYQQGQAREVQDWLTVQTVVGQSSDPLGDKFAEVRRIDDGSMFYFSAPVVDDNDVLVGGLLVGINHANFIRLLADQTLSAITLYDLQGAVIATTFRDQTTSNLALAVARVDSVLTNPDASSPVSREMEIEGVAYQFLYTPFALRSEQVGVIGTALPVDFVSDRIATSRNIFFLLFAGMIFAVGALGIVVSRSIVQPIFRIVDATRAIRSGDLSRRVNLNMPDELGELGRSVDDMTDRLLKQNQKILKLYNAQRQETARREAVLASISDAVLVLDAQGRTILQNDTAAALMDRLDNDPSPPIDTATFFLNLERFSQLQTLTLYGEHYSIMTRAVMVDSDTVLGHVMVFRDITAIVESEELKDDMILQLSHELRTPLTSARGYIELLDLMGAERLNEQDQDFVSKSLLHLDTLGGMIDQVIEVNALLTERLEIKVDDLDLSGLLQNVIDDHARVIAGAGIQLDSDLPAQPYVIKGDGEQLARAFGHILRNAYSYTLAGGTISVGMDTTGEHVAITITDSGVGIPPDEINKVFDKLYRGSSADAGLTDTRGMGLGLYLVKRIVDAHRGTVSIASEVGVGTTVTVTLPG